MKKSHYRTTIPRLAGLFVPLAALAALADRPNAESVILRERDGTLAPLRASELR